MWVVATYEIMHVIVYFGVSKCHGCSSHLCNWMFNRCMEYICCCSVCNDSAHRPYRGTCRWWFHQSLTIVCHQAFAHTTHGLLAAIVCIIIGLRTHFWLQTCLPRITHILLNWTVSVLLAQSKQFIQVNRLPYIAHTLIWLTYSFVLPNHKQFIRANRMLYIAHTFIWLPISFVPSHCKQLIEQNRMPCIAHTTKIWTVFNAFIITNVLHLFWWVFTPSFSIIASHSVSSKGLWS